MIDAATLAPLRTLAARVLALPDVDAACAMLFARGSLQMEVRSKLSIVCGEAERLADALESPKAAREYERRLADTFAPFAEIVRATLPESGTRYVRYEKEYKRTTLAAIAEEAKQRQVAQLKQGKKKPVPQKSAERSETRDKVAALAGVSHDTIAKVEKIVTEAATEVVEATRKGEMSINAAFRTVAPKPVPPEPQKTTAEPPPTPKPGTN